MILSESEIVSVRFVRIEKHILVKDVRDFLVQILPKAPNLAHMLPIPYFFDFRRAPPGAAILAKSNYGRHPG